MKNADDMLREILRTVDTSGDGKIQYEGMLLPSGVGRRLQSHSIYLYMLAWAPGAYLPT